MCAYCIVESLRKRSKDTTTQHERPESPRVTLTWHASKYRVQKLHQRYIFFLIFLSFCQEKNDFSNSTIWTMVCAADEDRVTLCLIETQ